MGIDIPKEIILKAHREHEELKNKKLNDPKSGLKIQLKKLEEWLKKAEKDLQDEFPNIDINSTGSIPFENELDEERYNFLKSDQEKAKNDISELKGQIELIEKHKEN